ncbi:MAG: hypothetical protein UR62_C0018G0006 [Candidatus Nomurabacteria bacterium GW2011_GWF2_35_12]|uniref:Uncharacterized protein n=3 Tax=Candidatus Nomuraibacteriota TaxID=1752729 RepID=A0A0G0H1M9_9BACT|nr:MAG: hypothetical protein UR62_C0018G0006 [Candidatus Nomurabacteria bacterium GW2011_GWF2_35_12]KKP72635.1 MAG: hypothetical protein UR70_C0006G0086 [Candidatus Nomurabacteria bacterium GW2011_GWB1_35_20]KKP76663.1 MAG: hypothetical protein UR72_C0001G0108 [Parcubacteria group bacterium GW2011_GWC1_35_21]KKP78530.1 MAG: hypothetical protein UR77_C0002G0082 [Candidatus Nomurabacteria bacterium GW2011_GWC2_35_35]KKP84068.1 MAG: hypothetical protein UR86_C0036G0003 [Parcubacteria group bacteri
MNEGLNDISNKNEVKKIEEEKIKEGVRELLKLKDNSNWSFPDTGDHKVSFVYKEVPVLDNTDIKYYEEDPRSAGLSDHQKIKNYLDFLSKEEVDILKRIGNLDKAWMDGYVTAGFLWELNVPLKHEIEISTNWREFVSEE